MKFWPHFHHQRYHKLNTVELDFCFLMEIESGSSCSKMTIFHTKNGFSWSNRFAFLRSIGLLTGQVTFDKYSVASSSPLLHNGIENCKAISQSFAEKGRRLKDDLNKKWQHVSAIKEVGYPHRVGKCTSTTKIEISSQFHGFSQEAARFNFHFVQWSNEWEVFGNGMAAAAWSMGCHA